MSKEDKKSGNRKLRQKTEDCIGEKNSQRATPSMVIPEVEKPLRNDERSNSTYSSWQGEEHFRSFIEESDAVILFVDPATARIVFANDAAVEFYGWSREELLQKTVHGY